MNSQLIPGITSVTLRRLSPADVLRFAAQGKLRAVEWSGDSHVPHDKPEVAAEVGAMTAEAGLKVVGYGSYYRIGNERDNPPFDKVLSTASALGAPTIRLWAGTRASAVAPPSYWNNVVYEARELAKQAADAGMTISFEYQANTLNDTGESSLRLIDDIDHEAVRTYWQPDHQQDIDQRVDALEMLLPKLTNVHAFFWAEGKRQPLEKGQFEWRKYLKVLFEKDGDHPILLELVEGDAPENLLRDADELIKLINLHR